MHFGIQNAVLGHFTLKSDTYMCSVAVNSSICLFDEFSVCAVWVLLLMQFLPLICCRVYFMFKLFVGAAAMICCYSLFILFRFQCSCMLVDCSHCWFVCWLCSISVITRHLFECPTQYCINDCDWHELHTLGVKCTSVSNCLCALHTQFVQLILNSFGPKNGVQRLHWLQMFCDVFRHCLH